MILNLKLQFESETGTKYTYQYGTQVLQIKKKKKSYKQLDLSPKEILVLKEELQNQLDELFNLTMKEAD